MSSPSRDSGAKPHEEPEMNDDFEEVAELLDKIVVELLAVCGIDCPPVHPKKIADKLGLVYGERELPGRRGQSFRRRGRQHVEVRRKDRPERKHFALAHEIMELQLKKVLDDPRECHRRANLGASFLLMPTEWFRDECLRTGFDLAELKKVFSTASWEAVALRTLNVSEAIITILDDGRVTKRKSSYPYYIPRKLSDEEKKVVEQVLRTGKTEGDVQTASSRFQTKRQDAASTIRRHFPSCEVAGYPVFEEERRRVILRTTFDE